MPLPGTKKYRGSWISNCGGCVDQLTSPVQSGRFEQVAVLIADPPVYVAVAAGAYQRLSLIAPDQLERRVEVEPRKAGHRPVP